jgi:hypothetical protein
MKFKEKTELDIIVPTRFSVEGLIEWFAKYCQQGGLIRDEFTSVFKETTKAYLGDNLEFLSELYDGMMQKRFTKSYKLEQVVKVYVVLLTATTPYLYKVMKPEFFVQGTGNRIRIEMFDGNVPKMDKSEDWEYNFSNSDETESCITKNAEKLVSLFKTNITRLGLFEKPLEQWVEYRTKINEEAKSRYEKDPMDLNYTYMVRLPEICVKLAGLHFFSRRIDLISLSGVPSDGVLEEQDIEYGIKKENESFMDFKRMLAEWRKYAPLQETVTSQRDRVWQICSVLASAPNRMFTTEQWQDAQDVTTNDTTFKNLRDNAISKGWVKQVVKEEITDPLERQRLKVDSCTNLKIWTITEEFFKV